MKMIDKETAETGDVVLQEVWQIKDRLSASCGHDLQKLFEITREHEKTSGRQIVSFEDEAPVKAPTPP
jgi:hypothetical protein